MKCFIIAAFIAAPVTVHFAHVIHDGGCPLYEFVHGVIHHDDTNVSVLDELAPVATESITPSVVEPAPAVAPTFDLDSTGISWHEGLDSVRDQGRPILLFQLLGRFDDTHC